MRYLYYLVLGIVFGVACHYLVKNGWAQHPPEHQALHEKFYQSWMRPRDRTLSCCSSRDCFPTQARKREGQWEALDRDGLTWVPIPEPDIEQERDNPDGQNHVCINPNSGQVLCFIPGGGA